MDELTIRQLRKKERDVLKHFLYQAIYQPDEQKKLPKTIIYEPEIFQYMDQWGKKDDHCYVAEVNGDVVGAVWVRILAGKIKGYGNIDDQTPEFAISIDPDFRNKGIGTALLKKMLDHLKEKKYEKTSLAVQKQNDAFFLYRKLGFTVYEESEEEYIMVYELKDEKQ